jgi:hypothetical protein
MDGKRSSGRHGSALDARECEGDRTGADHRRDTSSRDYDAGRHRKGVERPRRSHREGQSKMAALRGPARVGAAHGAGLRPPTNQPIL